jgi:uncharacterized protein YkwD
MSNRIIDGINAARQAAGLALLNHNRVLDVAAQLQADAFARLLPPETLGDRLAYVHFRTSAAVEVYASDRTEDTVVAAWLASAGPAMKVTGPYADCGIGVAKDRQGAAVYCLVLATEEAS